MLFAFVLFLVGESGRSVILDFMEGAVEITLHVKRKMSVNMVKKHLHFPSTNSWPF